MPFRVKYNHIEGDRGICLFKGSTPYVCMYVRICGFKSHFIICFIWILGLQFDQKSSIDRLFRHFNHCICNIFPSKDMGGLLNELFSKCVLP